MLDWGGRDEASGWGLHWHGTTVLEVLRCIFNSPMCPRYSPTTGLAHGCADNQQNTTHQRGANIPSAFRTHQWIPWVNAQSGAESCAV